MALASVSPDFVTIVTNVGVFLVAAGTVIAAIWSAVKKIKSVLPDQNGTATKMVGGAILDTSSILMWSESNREVAESNEAVVASNREIQRELMELRFAVTRLVDKKT